MKYLILIHSNPSVIDLFATMTDEERRVAYQTYLDVESELEKSGELVESKALDEKVRHYVRRGAGGPVVTRRAIGGDDGDHHRVLSGRGLR